MEKLANLKKAPKISTELSTRPENKMTIQIPRAITMNQLRQILSDRVKEQIPVNSIQPFKIPPHHENKLRTLRERQPQTATLAS